MKNPQIFAPWWERHCDEFRALLFDIDGTLISGGHVLPGAVEIIARLRAEKFPFCLLTNDGNHSTEEKSRHMRKGGLEIAPEEIVSCGDALSLYVSGTGSEGQTFFVMGDLGNPDYAEKAGLMVTRDLKLIDLCAGVIVGEGIYDWQATINGVLNHFIRHPNHPMLVPNPDSYWPNGLKGEIGIGAGGKARFISGILDEMGLQIEPVYLGKPYEMIYRHTISVLCTRFGLPHELPMREVLMLGDSLKSDIRGARRLDLRSGLLLTGISTLEQASQARGECRPDFIFSSLL
ncbi:MAG: hypothetical protein A2X49_12600 [Lentisphaerae bacterium GWF2_52_8]|nr:MAG: hypothetical protein A2X49_12600 [Lentisphaerae bacterium GWF2_52_8]